MEPGLGLGPGLGPGLGMGPGLGFRRRRGRPSYYLATALAYTLTPGSREQRAPRAGAASLAANPNPYPNPSASAPLALALALALTLTLTLAPNLKQAQLRSVLRVHAHAEREQLRGGHLAHLIRVRGRVRVAEG